MAGGKWRTTLSGNAIPQVLDCRNTGTTGTTATTAKPKKSLHDRDTHPGDKLMNASGKYAFSASPGPQNATCLRIPCGNGGHVLLVLSCRAVHSLLCYLEKRRECESWLLGHLFCFHLIISSPEGSGPRSEVVLYRGNPWPGRGKPLFHGPVPKISLIYELLDEQRIRY